MSYERCIKITLLSLSTVFFIGIFSEITTYERALLFTTTMLMWEKVTLPDKEEEK